MAEFANYSPTMSIVCHQSVANYSSTARILQPHQIASNVLFGEKFVGKNLPIFLSGPPFNLQGGGAGFFIYINVTCHIGTRPLSER